MESRKRKTRSSSRSLTAHPPPCPSEAILSQFNVSVPHSLIIIAPFLEEALHVLRQGVSHSRAVLSLSCLDHAFRMLANFDLTLDERGYCCVQSFTRLRDNLSDFLEREYSASSRFDPEEEAMLLLDGVHEHEKVYVGAAKRRRIRRRSDHFNREMILLEANAIFDLAENTYESGMFTDASRLYHTVSIYLEMAEPDTAELKRKLVLAGQRQRECANVFENFVHEHFGDSANVEDHYDCSGEVLGKGSFGSVILCTHRQTRDSCALKVIKLREINPYNVHLLHSEIKIMKALDHPNIVKLKEVFFGKREVHIVMELCSGGDLQTHLKTAKNGSLSESDIARLLRTMMSCVLYLHENGIVHRDIKLENFLFSGPSPGSQLKLIDFGLSKHFDEHESMARIAGTPYYVAPEIWEGCYDERCDVWALGVCAYIMLYRAMPFNGADVEEVQRKVLQDDPSYVPLLQASVSPLAERFVRSLLEKDPGMRIQLPIALEHPFIATPSSCTASVSRRTADSAANLVGYLHMTDTKKLLLKAVAFCLNTAQITQLSAGFDEMDKDKNGVICMTELRHALTHSEGVGKAQLEQVLEDVDLDPGAVLNYSEFLAAAMHRHLQVEEERLRLAFAKIDKDGTGHLTPESMRQFLGQDVGENRSVLEVLTSVSLRDAQPSIDGKVASMFSEMDYNNDGKIDYCEFLKYWRSISVVRHVNVKQRFASAVKRVVSGLKFITALKANQR